MNETTVNVSRDNYVSLSRTSSCRNSIEKYRELQCIIKYTLKISKNYKEAEENRAWTTNEEREIKAQQREKRQNNAKKWKL